MISKKIKVCLHEPLYLYSRRGSWRPIGHMRPSSPLLDSVRDLFEGQEQLAKDFTRAFAHFDNNLPNGSKQHVQDNKPEQKHRNSSVKYKKDHKPNLQSTFKRVDTESFDSLYKKDSPMTAGGVNKQSDTELSESLPLNNLFSLFFPAVIKYYRYKQNEALV